MFLGREYEIEELNRLYKKEGFQFAIIYGRRRVGKTSIIGEFCKDKRNIFYVAIERNDVGALASFSHKILEVFPQAKNIIDVFASWEKAFEYIYEQADGERFIIAIDEYPYIASGNSSISSILQKVIDTKYLNSNLFLILCGSSMSFMENQVLGYKSPLYGRRTAQFKIEPFDYYDTSKFFNNYSNIDKLICYGLSGGIPQYIKNIASENELKEAIVTNFLKRSGHLFEEPQNILKQELREPAVYNSIITAIAEGASRLNEIALKSGEESKKCLKYLKTLMDLRIVKKEYPISEKESRNSIYILLDNMFKFWYQFIPENISNIEVNMGDVVFEKKIMPNIPNYMGRVFEDICMQYVIRLNKKLLLPIMFDKIGRWWGNNPSRKRQEEIDFIAISKNDAIFCECKWRNEKADIEVLNNLIEKSNIFAKYKQKYYMIFSKSGFTSGLVEKAEMMENVRLVSVDDLFDQTK